MEDKEKTQKLKSKTAIIVVTVIWLVIFGFFSFIGDKIDLPYFDLPYPLYDYVYLTLISVFWGIFMVTIPIVAMTKLEDEDKLLLRKKWTLSCIIVLIFFQFYPFYPEVWEELKSKWEPTSFWSGVGSVFLLIILIIVGIIVGLFLLAIIFGIGLLFYYLFSKRVQKLFYRFYNSHELMEILELQMEVEMGKLEAWEADLYKRKIQSSIKTYFEIPTEMGRGSVAGKFLKEVNNVFLEFSIYIILLIHLFTPWSNWSFLSGVATLLEFWLNGGDY